jgi:hypothetical protein
MITVNAKVLAFFPKYPTTNEKTSVHAIMDGQVVELDRYPMLAPAPRGNSSKYNSVYLGLYIVEENEARFIIWLHRSNIDQWSKNGAFWVNITPYNQEIVDDFLAVSARGETFLFGSYCSQNWGFGGPAWTELEFVNYELLGWTRSMSIEKNTWMRWLQSQHRKLRLKMEFETALQAAIDAGATSEQVQKIKSSCKGAVVVGLDLLRYCLLSKEQKPVETIVRLISGYKDIVAKNIATLYMSKIDRDVASKVAQKAHAWAYIQKCIPGVHLVGHFDDALDSIAAYVGALSHGVVIGDGMYGFGDTSAKSDFAIKLNKALGVC